MLTVANLEPIKSLFQHYFTTEASPQAQNSKLGVLYMSEAIRAMFHNEYNN